MQPHSLLRDTYVRAVFAIVLSSIVSTKLARARLSGAGVTGCCGDDAAQDQARPVDVPPPLPPPGTPPPPPFHPPLVWALTCPCVRLLERRLCIGLWGISLCYRPGRCQCRFRKLWGPFIGHKSKDFSG
jgi:hypothetical protein